MKSSGLMFLGVWLIATHAVKLANFHFAYDKIIFASLALFTGVLLLLHTLKARLSDIGVILLGFWLVLRNSLELFKFNFQYSGTILEVLAVSAGVLLILRK